MRQKRIKEKRKCVDFFEGENVWILMLFELRKYGEKLELKKSKFLFPHLFI